MNAFVSTVFRATIPALLILTFAPALAAPAATLNNSFFLTPNADVLFWEPQVAYDSVVLVVSGPGDFQLRQEFRAGDTPYLSLFDSSGNALADGAYSYELRAVPVLTEAQKAALRQARETDDAMLRATLARELPQGAIQAGYFGVMGQEFLATELGEAATLSPTRLSGASPAANAGGAAAAGDSTLIPMAGQVVLTNGDGVIRNSLCVGFDCPDAPVFSDSTILLMENNTRIKFGDTSNAPFPNNDWEIEANSSLSGGQGYLGFNDCGTADNDGGCATDLVFAVEAGARQNALYVESDGDVGMGTSNPVVNIHTVDGNTPTLRLEQDGSSGFAPQTWDIAGNETNFFIRDVTGGSTLPFRIRPGAPTSSIDIAGSGNVGIGTGSPSSSLHVRRTDATAKATVEEASGTAAQRTLLQLTNNGGTEFRMTDSSTGITWLFQNTGGNFRFTDAGDAFNEFILTQAGNLTITGSLTVGPGGCTGCDLVFDPSYKVESIEEHAAYMWTNSHLPGVGPTPEDAPMNLSKKTGGILNELEKAHIYIEQLNGRLDAKDQEIVALMERLQQVEKALAGGSQE